MGEFKPVFTAPKEPTLREKLLDRVKDAIDSMEVSEALDVLKIDIRQLLQDHVESLTDSELLDLI